MNNNSGGGTILHFDTEPNRCTFLWSDHKNFNYFRSDPNTYINIQSCTYSFFDSIDFMAAIFYMSSSRNGYPKCLIWHILSSFSVYVFIKYIYIYIFLYVCFFLCSRRLVPIWRRRLKRCDVNRQLSTESDGESVEFDRLAVAAPLNNGQVTELSHWNYQWVGNLIYGHLIQKDQYDGKKRWYDGRKYRCEIRTLLGTLKATFW